MIGNYAELSVTLWLSCAIYLFFVNRKKNFLKRFLLASTGFCLGVAVIGLPVYLNLEVSFSMIRFGILYFLLCSLEAGGRYLLCGMGADYAADRI